LASQKKKKPKEAAAAKPPSVDITKREDATTHSELGLSSINAHLFPAVSNPSKRDKPSKPKPQISALKKPAKWVPPSQRPGSKKPQRESLSAQLAKIGDTASSITADIRDKHDCAGMQCSVLKPCATCKAKLKGFG
jgi:hypothetical protein